MQVEISGVIADYLIPTQVSEKLKKSTIVIDTGSKYDNLIPVDFINAGIDNLTLINPKIGDSVKVTAYLGGRKWENKYFVGLKGASIEKTGFSQGPTAPQGMHHQDSSISDLPF